MPRTPFAWEVQSRRDVLDDEVARLRELPYTLWRDVLKAPMTRTVSGRDERSYRLRIAAAYAARHSEDIRVSVTLASRILRRPLMRSSFVITPDNRFID